MWHPSGSRSETGMVGFASDWSKMGQIRGFFRSDFRAFGGFVPFGANLTHFGAKPTIPGLKARVMFNPCVHFKRITFHHLFFSHGNKRCRRDRLVTGTAGYWHSQGMRRDHRVNDLRDTYTTRSIQNKNISLKEKYTTFGQYKSKKTSRVWE